MGLAVRSVAAQSLPPEITAALARAKIPQDAVSLYVIDASPRSTQPLLAHRANAVMNPASVMKLVTSIAALELLGPAYTWQTQVLIDPAGRNGTVKDGTIKDGVLNGNLIMKGGGDPKLVVERLWLLFSRVRSLGIQTINGDIVLDASIFEVANKNPAAFDGEPRRPYNASPDGLLINYKSLAMTFTPMGGVAAVQYDPPLYGVSLPKTVPLIKGDCSDFPASLKVDVGDATRIRFLGGFPQNCGERFWSVAFADPASFAALAVRGVWESLGGRITGAVHSGPNRPEAKLAFVYHSPPLAEVIQSINKFSNNVMAQQLFLTLSASDKKAASFEASRSAVLTWWQRRLGAQVDAPVLDNGAGLSRSERITAAGLARLLQLAYGAPYMPELLASLPQVGVDGTLKRSKAQLGSAHLKTGSLNNVAARAGYVDSQSADGKRYVLVAMINSDHPAVIANAREFFDSLIDWTAQQ